MAERSSRRKPPKADPNVRDASERAPLVQHAIEVKRLATELREGNATAALVAALQQRKQELSALADRADSLAATAASLRASGATVSSPETSTAARKSLGELRSEYGEDAQAASDKPTKWLKQPLDSVETSLKAAWQRLLPPTAAAKAIAELLRTLPDFAEPRKRLLEVVAAVEKAQASLPRTGAEAALAADWRRQVEQQLAKLEDAGVDRDVQDFLRAAGSGVPLDSLLKNEAVLGFLRKYGLLGSLSVTFRDRSR